MDAEVAMRRMAAQIGSTPEILQGYRLVAILRQDAAQREKIQSGSFESWNPAFSARLLIQKLSGASIVGQQT
jgi:hypothetical protein